MKGSDKTNSDGKRDEKPVKGSEKTNSVGKRDEKPVKGSEKTVALEVVEKTPDAREPVGKDSKSGQSGMYILCTIAVFMLS